MRKIEQQQATPPGSSPPTNVSAAMAQLKVLEQRFISKGKDHKHPKTAIHTVAAASAAGCNVAIAITAGTVRSQALQNAVAATGCYVGPTIVLDAWHSSGKTAASTRNGKQELIHVYHPANCKSRTDFEVLYGPDLEHEDPAQYEWVTFTEPLSRAAAELDLEVVITNRHIASSSSVPAGTVATATMAYPLVAKQVFQSSIPLTLSPAKELVTCTPLAMMEWQEVESLAAIAPQPNPLPPSPPPSPPSSSPELGRSTTVAAQSCDRSDQAAPSASWGAAAAAALAEVVGAAEPGTTATVSDRTAPVNGRGTSVRRTRSPTRPFTLSALPPQTAVGAFVPIACEKGVGGRIRVVGAGPGGPELLTVAAARALAEADVVVSDRLVPESITDLAKPGSTLFVARKTPGRAAQAQAELDEAVLLAAAAGKDVVRLKGGDPFLFGRGGEEIRLYRKHGYVPELIPGLSSCIAGPAAAMIPVTHRGVADKLMVVSAHGKAGSAPSMPTFMPACTYVFMMGVGRLGTITKKLISQHGFPASLPVAIVQEAWHPGRQRTVHASLNDIASEAKLAQIQAPAVIIVGEVTQEGLLAAAAISAPKKLTGASGGTKETVAVHGGKQEEPCGTFQDDSFIA